MAEGLGTVVHDTPLRGAIDEVIAAVMFLTRVPVGRLATGRARTGAAAFGLVGLVLGLAAAVPLLLAGVPHPLPAAIASLALLAFLDGGLHLDGLADTFDALAAPAGNSERARTDPRAGTAGVIAIVVVLGLQAAALAELGERDGLLAAASLIAAVTVSRATAPGWAVAVGRRMAPPDGLGRWFADATSRTAAAFAITSAAVVIAVLTEMAGIGVGLAAVGGSVAAVVAGAIVLRLRRQLDGDGSGAVIELTVVAVLVAATLLAGAGASMS